MTQEEKTALLDALEAAEKEAEASLPTGGDVSAAEAERLLLKLAARVRAVILAAS